MEDFGSGGGIAVLGADYDVPTVGKGLDGQAFPCFASHQDGLTDGLPFEVKLDEPNEVTYAAMAAAEKDEDMYGPFDSVAEMMEALNA